MKFKIVFVVFMISASLYAIEEKYMHNNDAYKKWLLYAQEDLDAATILINNQTPQLRSALVLAHQSVEKGLKAYLTYKKIDFEKTHNLKDLLCYCKELDNEFIEQIETISDLNRYTNTMRYPNSRSFKFNNSKISEIVQKSKSLLFFILKKIR
jgi:HEPN domain-containing protein